MHDRIAVRAYYAAQNDGYAQAAEHYWLEAEQHEILIAFVELERKRAKRSEAAKRGAATRKRNAAIRASQHAASIIAMGAVHV